MESGSFRSARVYDASGRPPSQCGKKEPAELKLAPSILNSDFARLADAVQAAEAAGADWIHVDVMDGHFVPNLTFGPKMVADLRAACALPLDVHLMIERPERWIDRYAEAGASFITIHVETTDDVAGTLQGIRRLGARPGITLNPGTPVERILPHLAAVDLALVMSVQPGFGGQAFIEAAIERIRAIRVALDERGLARVELEVDGGIKPENAKRVADAGASVLVAGSAVYLDPAGPAAALAKLRRAVAG